MTVASDTRPEPDFLHFNLMRVRGFGTLLFNGESSPIALPVPLIFSDDLGSVETHVPVGSALDQALVPGMACTVTVHGPDGYISPDWYGSPGHLPTWNYAMVEVRGNVEVLPEPDLPAYLERLSSATETRLAPKAPWSPDVLSKRRMRELAHEMRALRIRINDVSGTWKLSQDKPDACREAAASQLKHSPLGQHTEVLAALMVGGGVTGLDF